MAMAAFYATEEEVPAGDKEHYSEANGQWVLQLSNSGDGWAVENVTGLKSALSKQTDGRKRAETALQAFSALNTSAADIATQLEEYVVLKESAGNESEVVKGLNAQITNIRQAQKDEISKVVAPLESRNGKLVTQLETALIDVALTKEIIDAKGSVPLLIRALKDEIKATIAEDGTFSFAVVDAEGTPRVTGADLAPMGLKALVAEKKAIPDFARAFEGTDASGNEGAAGGAGGGGGNGQLTPEQVDAMSMAEYRTAREKGTIK